MKIETEQGVFQVVFNEVLAESFQEWIESKNLCLYPIPVGDDLPTYGITRKADFNENN